MSLRKENLWSAVAVAVAVIMVGGPFAFRLLYQATIMASKAGDVFVGQDLLTGTISYSIPLAITATLLVTGLLVLRWTMLRHVLIPISLSVIIIGILTAESIWFASKQAEDWVWRGLPALVTILPCVIGLLWGRWVSSRRTTALYTGIASALLVTVLYSLLIPRLWFHEPIFQSTRIDRIDRDLPPPRPPIGQ